MTRKPSKSLKFGDQRFNYYGQKRLLSDAESSARNLRRSGWLVRIVPRQIEGYGTQYMLYRKRSSSKRPTKARYVKVSAKCKLLRMLKDGRAKVEKEVWVYEGRYPLKHHLYIWLNGRRVQVFITSGSFYGLPKGRYVRRKQRGEK